MGAFALILLLTSGTANAAAPTELMGTLSGDYAHSDSSGVSGNAWGFNAAGAFGLGTNDLGAELNGSYHRASASGVDLDAWGLGGSLFWAPGMGRLGATATYQSFNFGGLASGLDAHATTYGVFGEYFGNEFFTLGAKGGGLSGEATLAGFGSGSDTGSYVGGSVTAYPISDFALNGSVDYVDFSGVHITTYGATAEYLISEMMPFSIFGGYARTDFSAGLGSADTWFVGVKFYPGGPTAPLVTRHRNGTLGPVGTVSGLKFAL
jgi:hypothetical protein